MAFYYIAKIQDIPEGSGVFSNLQGHSIAVFKITGEYFAIQNRCPHRGASLVDGEIKGFVVTCPWHAWQFDIKTGCFLENSQIKLKQYSLEVRHDELWVELT
ncbi:MAG: Rieske (2Fe-2S) protein [Deltaproteobacteria bacterium]|nr:Rieske (2Fe-2S) protein [Deltaproteobacteria bacterium]